MATKRFSAIPPSAWKDVLELSSATMDGRENSFPRNTTIQVPPNECWYGGLEHLDMAAYLRAPAESRAKIIIDICAETGEKILQAMGFTEIQEIS